MRGYLRGVVDSSRRQKILETDCSIVPKRKLFFS